MQSGFSITCRVIVIFFIFLVIASCDKDSDNSIEYDHLISFEKKYTLQIPLIISILNDVANDHPEIFELADSTNYEVDVYSISYKTSYKEEEIIASGLICLPSAFEGFPILSFQNGTNTSHMNAPSINLSNPMFLLLQCLAGNGYIILVPDYIGFGISSDKLHPYYVKPSTNSAVVDMMYAAQEFIENYSSGANYNDQFFLMGYSQGGWATLSALEEIEANHSTAFEIHATSCGAGAYDLLEVSDYIIHLDTFPSPLYLPYYIYSHQQYGTLTDSLNTFFREPYSSIIPELFSGVYSNSYINKQLTDTVSQLLSQEFIEGLSNDQDYESLRSDLAANTVKAWSASSLIRFYHGTADMNVPPSESQNIYSGFIELGLESSVELFEMEDKNHETGALPWGIETIIWFNEIKASY
jgi:pimeloyl-ACP methyl ester carboxylesterase